MSIRSSRSLPCKSHENRCHGGGVPVVDDSHCSTRTVRLVQNIYRRICARVCTPMQCMVQPFSVLLTCLNLRFKMLATLFTSSGTEMIPSDPKFESAVHRAKQGNRRQIKAPELLPPSPSLLWRTLTEHRAAVSRVGL